MVEEEIRGGLSYTPNDHRKMGSSGSGFGHLIEGKPKPDVPYGQQMTDEALKEYYNYQLDGLRMYLELTPEQLAKIQMGLVKKIQADLPYLEGRGVNTVEAKLVLEKLKE